MKHGPNIRKCVITHQRLEKNELIRVVKVNEVVKIDQFGNIKGRGAYVIPKLNIVLKAKKKNAFARALKTKVNDEIYDNLINLLSQD